jgi:hypothetical protein
MKHNLTQVQYTRIVRGESRPEDVTALLGAYEQAVTLLDRMLSNFEDSHAHTLIEEVEDFLYDEQGEQRVKVQS